MNTSQPRGELRAPPERPNHAATRIAVPKKGELFALLTGDAITGVWTHWLADRKRTLPCLGLDCFCRQEPAFSRWIGYISCWTQPTEFSGVLEVTEYLARQLLVYVDGGVKLRGLELRLWRDRNRGNGPVLCAIHKQHDPLALAPGFSPRPMLLRMWGGAVALQGTSLQPMWDDPWAQGKGGVS